MNDLHEITIFSGGQTGVDRAALDFALLHQIACGGWCSIGRKAEDGRIPDHYPLKEMPTPAYSDRTKQNVEDSDATLILYDNTLDEGTKLTVDFCKQLKKPFRVHSVKESNAVSAIQEWLVQQKIRTLNVAGSRESSEVGIYEKCVLFFGRLFLREW